MNFIEGKIVKNGCTSFKNDDVNIDLSELNAASLENIENTDVVLGIRPEHVQCLTESSSLHNVGKIQSRVEVIEPMGNEIFLYARAGRHSLTARIAPHAHPKVGDDCILGLDLHNVHFFDKKDERKID